MPFVSLREFSVICPGTCFFAPAIALRGSLTHFSCAMYRPQQDSPARLFLGHF